MILMLFGVHSENSCLPKLSLVPVSRIEFVPESSVYWPIIGLGMPT